MAAIFIDSNIPMYLVGAAHPHKIDAQRLLEQCIMDRARLVTDAEVFQEIMHRYCGLNRRDAIQPAFDALNGLIDEIFPIEGSTIERAKKLLLSRKGLSSRDALHVAIMLEHDIKKILTFDKDFDQIASIERIS